MTGNRLDKRERLNIIGYSIKAAPFPCMNACNATTTTRISCKHSNVIKYYWLSMHILKYDHTSLVHHLIAPSTSSIAYRKRTVTLIIIRGQSVSLSEASWQFNEQISRPSLYSVI